MFSQVKPSFDHFLFKTDHYHLETNPASTLPGYLDIYEQTILTHHYIYWLITYSQKKTTSTDPLGHNLISCQFCARKSWSSINSMSIRFCDIFPPSIFYFLPVSFHLSEILHWALEPTVNPSAISHITVAFYDLEFGHSNMLPVRMMGTAAVPLVAEGLIHVAYHCLWQWLVWLCYISATRTPVPHFYFIFYKSLLVYLILICFLVHVFYLFIIYTGCV